MEERPLHAAHHARIWVSWACDTDSTHDQGPREAPRTGSMAERLSRTAVLVVLQDGSGLAAQTQ